MAMVDPALERKGQRALFLEQFGFDGQLIPQLLEYGEALIADDSVADLQQLPLMDEPFVKTWERYEREAEQNGAWAVLNQHLVQLAFPIDSSIADSPEYLAATRRGIRPSSPHPPTVVAPDKISIHLQSTLAGRIPVITMAQREDFVTVVRALLRKNSEETIPESMGASMVAGYTNWERIERYREQWERSHPFGNWADAFKDLVQDKSRYQDRFILLSGGAYSGIAGKDVNISAPEWKSTSIELRREHECVHYFTRRVFGSMRNSLLDELIADAVAVRQVAGRIRKDWLLQFFGIENLPEYRTGGRLENYVPESLLSGFDQLTELMALAIENVALVDDEVQSIPGWSNLIFTLALCSCSLDELARPDGPQILRFAGDDMVMDLG